jgi:hypothetical protein
MKHTITGHLYWQHNKYLKAPRITFSEYDKREWKEDSRDGNVHITEYSFEVDVPDDFDPRPAQIAALNAEIKSVRAEFTARINELQAQKARLLAIENTATVDA